MSLDRRHIMGDCAELLVQLIYSSAKLWRIGFVLALCWILVVQTVLCWQVFNNQLSKEKKKWFVVFPDFHGETTPNVADSKPSV